MYVFLKIPSMQLTWPSGCFGAIFGKNQTNITNRKNRAIGNINIIESTLRERQPGRH